MGELLSQRKRWREGKGRWLEMGLEKSHSCWDLQALVRSTDLKANGKPLWSFTGKCHLLNSAVLDVALVLRE